MQCMYLSVTVKIRSSYGKPNSLHLLNCYLWNIIFNFSWTKGNGKKILIQENPSHVICRCELWKKAGCPYASKKGVPEQHSSVRYLWFKCVLQLHALGDHVWNMTSSLHTDSYKSISWWNHFDPDKMTFYTVLCKQSEAFHESLTRQKNHFLQQPWFEGELQNYFYRVLSFSRLFSIFTFTTWHVERAQKLIGCVTP